MAIAACGRELASLYNMSKHCCGTSGPLGYNGMTRYSRYLFSLVHFYPGLSPASNQLLIARTPQTKMRIPYGLQHQPCLYAYIALTTCKIQRQDGPCAGASDDVETFSGLPPRLWPVLIPRGIQHLQLQTAHDDSCTRRTEVSVSCRVFESPLSKADTLVLPR